MKKVTISLISISVAALLFMNSCRNKEDATDPSVTDAEMNITTTQATDNDKVTGNIDDAMDKVNTDLAADADASARLDLNNICGYTVDRSNYNGTISGTGQKTIVYTFNNQTCDGRTRSGTVTATLVSGNYFKDEGAVYNLVFDGYAVTKDGETATLTGTQTVTNVTGGLPRFVITKPSQFAIVTHKVTGNMQLTFSNAAGTRNWSIDREISWANTNGVLSYSFSSSRTVDGYTNVSSTGTNRIGYTFYTQMLTPLVANSTCGWYRPISGERKHTLVDTDGTILYTSLAQVNTGSDGCGNGFTITSTNKKGKTRTVTITY